jgi:hypothetical protein
MGREATAQCKWGNETGNCKVLLETTELVLRGELRHRVPIAGLEDVAVSGDELRFRVDKEKVALSLGSELAQKWAKALATPPPSLAKKLGISASSRLLVIGEVDSPELSAAVSEAASIDGTDADLMIISVTSAHELNLAVNKLQKRRAGVPPFWIVYPKGPGQEFGESSVRAVLRERGFIDTKMASVSPRLTALRFILRKG